MQKYYFISKAYYPRLIPPRVEHILVTRWNLFMCRYLLAPALHFWIYTEGGNNFMQMIDEDYHNTYQHHLDKTTRPWLRTKHFRGGYMKNTVIFVGWLSIWMFFFLRWIISIQRRYMYVLCVAFGFGFALDY